MAGFGGAVKLTGESAYKKALSQITQSLREVSSEMKTVTSQYDKNDKSIDALTSKQDVLNKKYDLQKEKLDTLKSKYDSMKSAYDENKNKHEQLLSEYDKEKTKLDQIGQELGETSEEYKKQKDVVANLEAQVKKSTTAQDANEKSMSNMRIQINNAQADCNKTANELDRLGQEIKSAGDDASGTAQEMSNAGDAIEELGTASAESAEEAKKSSDGYTVFKDVISDLATDAIQKALEKLKEFAQAIVDLGKMSIEGYASFEQLQGGVEKIFGDDVADKVIANANKAFSTAGMSANDYMETVTGFSSSLIQSLDGDTTKAVDVADRAIRDMSDNANTFGTDMSSIQYAYQGFAKQNYTINLMSVA